MNSFIKNFVISTFLVIFLIPISGAFSQERGVTLSWSADSYTPPEYIGRALPTYGSIVEVVAMLNISANPDTAYYKWYLNGEIESVGMGQSVFSFKMHDEIRREYKIRLKVSDYKGNELASSDFLILTQYDPKVVIQSDTFNIYPNETLKFTAQPFFFNINNPDDLVYKWRLQDQSPTYSGKEKNVLLFSVKNIAYTFQDQLKVLASHPARLLHKAEGSATIFFSP